jgi:hypothetical protein
MEEIKISLKSLPYWNFLRIVEIIEKKATNIANTNDIIQLMDKLGKDVDLSELIRMEMIKRLFEIYQIAKPLLEQYNVKIELNNDLSRMTIREILETVSVILSKIYGLMKDLGMLPVKRERDIEAEEASRLDIDLYET